LNIHFFISTYEFVVVSVVVAYNPSSETLDFTAFYLSNCFSVGTTFFELSSEVHRGVPEAIDHIPLNP